MTTLTATAKGQMTLDAAETVFGERHFRLV